MSGSAIGDPAVVTGIGVVAPNGVGTENYWAATLAGKNGIASLSLYDAASYPCKLAGEVPEFDATQFISRRLMSQTDHMTHLAFAAAEFALTDAEADVTALPEYELAVVTANSSGGTMFGQRELEKLWSKGPDWVGAYMAVAWFYAATTGQLSIRYGMRGPCGVFAAEQAGGLDSLAQGRRLLSHGDARLVIVGGTDASLSPAGLTAQVATRNLSTSNDPNRAYLPFDVQAQGYVPGQGGAILVMETLASAAGRGVRRPYGIVAGHASTFDPPPGSGRPPGIARTAALALEDAGLGPGDIDVVFADASGVPGYDQAEAAAIAALFGPYRVPVTAPKTMTGRLYGGGSALDIAAALLSIRDGVIPPTINVTEVVPGYDIDLVLGNPRETLVRSALVLSRGYGGFNSAVVLTGAG